MSASTVPSYLTATRMDGVDLDLFAGFADHAPATGDFRSDVLTGLDGHPKTLPSKYLYDEHGSELFDAICDLEEYYPTRTEISLLERYAPEMAHAIGPGCRLVEFGCGSIRKMRLLLAHLETPASFLPIDISRAHLLKAAATLATDYPDLPVHPICADFTTALLLPPPENRAGRTVGFFPGSTIGNFTPAGAHRFLERAADLLGPGGLLLLGVDLKKDEALLRAAYNDSEGITAAFNLNLLTRINRELNGTFAIEQFRHEALYNPDQGRMEMHLFSAQAQNITVANQPFSFEAGESIHTENSYKYTVAEVQALGRGAGYQPLRVWQDEQNLFSIHLLEVSA